MKNTDARNARKFFPCVFKILVYLISMKALVVVKNVINVYVKNVGTGIHTGTGTPNYAKPASTMRCCAIFLSGMTYSKMNIVEGIKETAMSALFSSKRAA